MSIQSPTGILDVTNATLRAGKLESTGDITCSSNLVVSGGFDLSAINSNADTVVDFTATRQLRKYPREILTSDSQNGYTITASENTNTSKYRAFNEDTYGTNERWVSQWVSGTGGRYDRTTGFYDGATYDDCLSTSSGTPEGEWLAIQVPEAFVLHSFEIVANSSTNSMDDSIARGQAPRDFQVWASNNGTAWTKVFEIEDADAPSGVRDGRTFHTSGVTVAYNRYALVVTRNGATYPNSTQWADVVTVGELRYYGYADGDGQDVRLRAHANAPNTDFLDVHFDANVVGSYPGNGTTLTDLSGEAHHGTLNNGVGFDSTYGALTFNGSNQNVNTQALGIWGDFVHAASLWIKPTVNQSALSATDWSAFFYIGEEPNTAATQAIAISYRKDELRYWFGANDVDVTTDFKANEWVHLAVVYRGGGGTAVNRDVYVNGVKQRYLRTDGSNYGDALNVQSTAFLRLGAAWGTNAAPYQDFNGSIANFRLFKRPLIEAEIHQLYDWEKVRFGRVALGDVVAFRDGSLGVGVAEPSRDDRLVVDGRANFTDVKTSRVVDRNDVVVYEQTGPHDRPLTKYPEIAMTSATTGGYTVTESGTPYPGGYQGWRAFDEVSTTEWITDVTARYNSTAPFDANSPSTDGLSGISGVSGTRAGSWIKLELPRKIRLEKTEIFRRDVSDQRFDQAYVYGSNDDTNWYQLSSITDPAYGQPATASGDMGPSIISRSTDSTTFYKYFVIQVTSLVDNTGHANIGQAYFYGYEEGDVSTDSTWTSVLNKPGTQHLEVYWDGADSNSYPGAGTEVFDLSGNGFKGTLTNNTTFDSTYDAWKWNTTGPSGITGSLAVSGGDWAHSFSYWMKVHSLPSSGVDYLFGFASAAAYSSIAHYINTSGQLVVGSWTLDYPVENFTIPVGEWFHVVVAYQGGGFSPNVNAKTYINGKLMKMGANISSGTDGTALTVPTTVQVIYFGFGYGGVATQPDATAGPFRMYSGKALNAEQVKELYDYDAERFGHRTNVVSLHKGNLGVGVSQPTSRFEVAGADGVFEYPPMAMTGYETYMEGHGVFRASQSQIYTPSANYTAWKVFDKSLAYGAHFSDSYSSTNDYIYDGAGTRSDGLGGFSGEWVMLEMPYAINLKSFAIAPASVTRAPEDFVILASNDGTVWTQLINYTGLGSSDWPYVSGDYVLKNFTVPITKEYYRYFAIVVTRTESNDYLQIDAMEYYGTPAPTTLDDGHLTLGKALTTPRVSGHAAGAETPRAESLVVHYDTSVDSVVSGATVVDTSGSGNNGTLHGVTYSVPNRTLHGDGISAGDYTKTPITISGGAMPFSISMWFRPETFLTGTSTSVLSFMGNKSSGAGVIFSYRQDAIWQDLYGKGVLFYVSLSLNRWYHVTTTYNGGNIESGSSKMYLDGVEITSQYVSGTGSVNLPTSTNLELFDYINASNDRHQGDISNFKLWDVALTADEIAAEYALGRTGKALNVIDTAVCLGGRMPRAQLDVRGSARFDGHLNVSSGNNNGSPVSILNGWKTLTWSGTLVANGTKSVVIFDRSGRGSSNGGEIAGEVTVVVHRNGVNQTRAYSKYHVNYAHWYGTTFYGENNEYSNYNNLGISNIQVSTNGGAGTVSIEIACTESTVGQYYIKFDGPIYIP